MSLRVKGVIVPLLTPFDDRGELDCPTLVHLVDFLIERGVHGLFPGGTTGEGPLLSTEERLTLAETVVRAANGRLPVIIHTGAITTREAIELTRHAHDCGAAAAALITPYYFRFSAEALFQHFASVCEAVPDYPIYLYNNPAVTNNVIDSTLVARLADAYPQIIGMKDSSGRLENLLQCMPLHNGTFNTASGNDGDILAALALGIDACVSGNANYFPELITALYHAASSADLAVAQTLQGQVNMIRQILEDGQDLSLFKGVLARRGLGNAYVRPPLLRASAEKIDACVEELTQFIQL